MAESTLTIRWQLLQARAGSFLGWGAGPVYGSNTWTTDQQFNLDGIVASGLRKFYFPEPQQGSGVVYDWSFLKPTAIFALNENQSIVNLPDDYGGVEGTVSVVTTTQASNPWRIEWRNIGVIRRMQQALPVMTGPPQYISQDAIRGTNPTQGQRFQWIVFPIADQDYSLEATYYVNPDYLTQDTPFALGGSQHSETILEAVLSAAEQFLDDQRGIHTLAFENRLAASIGMDRKNKPQKLGLNRDRSDDQWETWNNHYWAPPCTYDGQSFG